MADTAQTAPDHADSPVTPHVFVTRADLTHLACHAWMCPTDRTLSVRPYWREHVTGLDAAIADFDDTEFRAGRRHASPAPNWELDQPLPVFTAVPYSGFGSADELVEIIEEFIAIGAEAVRARESLGSSPARRPVPLLGMPIFGAQGGGGGKVLGDLIATILRSARRAAIRHGVDVALVVRDAKQLALAQRIRRERHDEVWSALDDRLKDEAESLADAARSGHIVPFMGAGISMSAGAPSWGHLVERLGERVGLTEDESQALQRRGMLDQAEILKGMYDSGDLDFGEAIKELVDMEHYGLAPTLLASLPLEQAITLNYDRLFEQASEDAGAKCTVIPGDEGEDASRWLLKLHGSIDDPGTIVLTRDDYMGFDVNRSVLSALVKASLMTKRLVFVGFGLTDDHFHQILHDVRQIAPTKISKNAVALTLSKDVLDDRAWSGKITLVPMVTESGAESSSAGRILEIFLDYVLALATDSRVYLLDETYSSQLTAEEQQIKSGLKRLSDSLAEVPADDASRVAVEAALADFDLRI